MLENNKLDLVCIVVAFVVYFFNRFVLKSATTGNVKYFCKNHLNDLVCPLFFLGISQIVLKLIHIRLEKLISILSLTIAGAFVWEVIGPWLNPQSVGDPIDVLCYVAGGLVYYFLNRFIDIRTNGD